MSEKIQEKKEMNISLSVGPKAGTPANQQTRFKLEKCEDILNSLPDITQNWSYSAIEFYGDMRHGDCFSKAHMIILDFDDGMTINQALEVFKFCYGMIATTKSHQQSTKGGLPNGKAIEKRDRFRVILFLEKPIEDKIVFVTVMTNFINEYGSDKACKDLARYYYPNPIQQHWFLMQAKGYIDIDRFKKKIENKKVSNVPSVTGTNAPGSIINPVKNEYIPISAETEIKSTDGDIGTALSWYENMEVDEKVNVHCPFPDHEDKTPSAFITKTDKKSLFASCSSCGRKGFYNVGGNNRGSSTSTALLENDVTIKQFSNVLIQKLKTVGEFNVNNIIKQFDDSDIPYTAHSGQLYLFIDGYWQRHDTSIKERDVFVKAVLKKVTGTRPETQKTAKLHRELLSEDKEIEALDGVNGVYVNFNNRVMKIVDENISFVDHNMEYGLKYKLPYPYNPDAICPNIDQFMLETMGDQETVDFFYRFVASTFISNDVVKIEKALFLHGAGSNGKSVVLDLLQELVGKNNTSSVALKDFSDEKKRVLTIGKLLNIASEGSAKSFDTEDFKAMISREFLTVKHLYKDYFETNAFPRYIFATNNLSSTGGDFSYGIMRRIEIIPFDNIVPEEKQDRKLLSKLLPELPGMMNRVIHGLYQLLEKGALNPSERVVHASKKYEIENNPVKYFLTENHFVQDNDNTPIYDVKKLYFEFKQFCIDEGISSVQKNTFSKQVSVVFGKQVHSNKLYGWRIRKNI